MRDNKLLHLRFLGLFLGFLLPYTLFSQFTLVGSMSGAPFESSISHAFSHPANVGDFNNDGYPDWAIGDPGGEYVYLFFGGAALDTFPDIQFDPGVLSGGYGQTLCGGDLNGDGINDLVVGAYYSSAGIQYAAGRVFIYYGGSSVDTIADVVIDGQVWRGFFGKTVVSGGDVNGDGWDDLLVLAEEQWTERGSVYLYLGGPSFDTVVDGQIVGEIGDGINGALDFVGDVNGDGCDEFLIGASQWGTDLPGRAYLVFGADQISLDSAVILLGDSVYSENAFGRRVAGLGDVNGDSIPDFGVAAMNYCILYSGDSLEYIWYKTSGHQWNSFSSIEGVEINNDEFNDVLFGLHYYPNTYSGKVTLYLGNTSIDTIPDAELTGDHPQQNFGFKLASGDFDCDGYEEVLISTEYLENRNKTYLYRTGPLSAINSENFPLLPLDIQIFHCYPNPFNSSTIISYIIPNKGLARLLIYDVQGKAIREFELGVQIAGEHRQMWDGTDSSGKTVASGIYFCRLQFNSTNKRFERLIELTLLK